MNNRCRVIMDELIASGELEELQDFEYAPKQELTVQLQDVLDKDVPQKYTLSALNIKFMNSLWVNDTRWRKMKNPIDKCAGTICATHSKGLPRGAIIQDKLVQDKIYADGSIDPDSVPAGTCRRLTPRECFRLQAFDESFIFPMYGKAAMSDTQLYKQAGNTMSINVLEMILTQLEGKLQDGNKTV